MMPAVSQHECQRRQQHVNKRTRDGAPAHQIAAELHIGRRAVEAYRHKQRKLPPHPFERYYHEHTHAWPYDDPDNPPACREFDPELWFPHPGDSYSRHRAIGICHTCPIEVACLAFALATDTRFGIWGGLNENQRAKISGKRP